MKAYQVFARMTPERTHALLASEELRDVSGAPDVPTRDRGVEARRRLQVRGP